MGLVYKKDIDLPRIRDTDGTFRSKHKGILPGWYGLSCKVDIPELLATLKELRLRDVFGSLVVIEQETNTNMSVANDTANAIINRLGLLMYYDFTADVIDVQDEPLERNGSSSSVS